MSILSKKYRITMPDGTDWDIPIKIIAKHHARFFSKQYDGDETQSLADCTLPMFTQHSYEIASWARNQMTWEDVKEHAVQVIKPAESYSIGWIKGKHKIVS